MHHSLLAVGGQGALDLWYASLRSLYDPYSIATKIVMILFPGDVPVTLFFVLSGSVLFHSLMLDKRPPGALSINFVYRRFLRIYPALLVSLIVTFAVQRYLGSSLTFPDLLENAALWSFRVNGPTWTLNVEFVVVPVFLLTCFAFRRSGELGMILFFLALWLVSAQPWLKPYPEFARPALLAFLLGMLIPTRVGEWLAERFPAGLWIPVAAFMMMSRYIESRSGSILQQVSAALFVTLLYHDKLLWLNSVLRAPFAQFAGGISYSFYLFHVILIVVVVHGMTALVGPAMAAHPLEYGLLVALVAVALTIPVGLLSKLLFEDPFIRLGRRRTFQTASEAGLTTAKPAE